MKLSCLWQEGQPWESILTQLAYCHKYLSFETVCLFDEGDCVVRWSFVRRNWNLRLLTSLVIFKLVIWLCCFSYYINWCKKWFIRVSGSREKLFPCICYGAIKKTGLTRSFWKHSLLCPWQPALNCPQAPGKLWSRPTTVVLAHLLAWAPFSLDSISLMIWSSPPPPTLLLPLLLFPEQPHDLFLKNLFILYCSFPGGLGGKEPACIASRPFG